MYTRFDIRDIQSLKMERVVDSEEGLMFNFFVTAEEFPDKQIPVPQDEFIRLTRSSSRRIGKEIIEA